MGRVFLFTHRSSFSTLRYAGCCAVTGLVPRALFIGMHIYFFGGISSRAVGIIPPLMEIVTA